MAKICKKCGLEYPDKDPYCARPKCMEVNILKVMNSATGAFFSFFEGFKYPYKGYPDVNIVGKNAAMKRTIMASIRLIIKIIKHPFKIYRNLLWWVVDIYSADFEKSQLPAGAFCPTSQEIIRVGNNFAARITDPELMDWVIRFTFCVAMICEYDSAYRYRLQDILILLDKKALLENPRKEIIRLMKIEKEREVGGQAFKMENILKIANVILFLSPKVKRTLRNILLDVNIENVRPDAFDRYFIARYFDYNFFGQTFEERMAWKEKEDAEWEQTPEAEVNPENYAQVQYIPNNFFYQLTEKQVVDMTERIKADLLKRYKEAPEDLKHPPKKKVV